MNSRTLCSHGAYLESPKIRFSTTMTIITDREREVQVHGFEVGGNVQRVDDESVRGNRPAFKDRKHRPATTVAKRKEGPCTILLTKAEILNHKYSLVRPGFVLTWEAQRPTTGSMDGLENR